jgi:hypothetical protein
MPSVGDWGFDVEVPLYDSAGAPWSPPTGSTATFLFQKPDGTPEVERTGLFSGTLAYYTVPEDFIDQSGLWSYVLTIEWPTGGRTVDRAYFDVEPRA